MLLVSEEYLEQIRQEARTFLANWCQMNLGTKRIDD